MLARYPAPESQPTTSAQHRFTHESKNEVDMTVKKANKEGSRLEKLEALAERIAGELDGNSCKAREGI